MLFLFTAATMSESKMESDDEIKISTPNYFNWSEIFPELQILKDNIAILENDMRKISRVS